MDISSLMRQAQAMQEKLQEAQKEAQNLQVSGSSGAGQVVVNLSGRSASSIKIDRSLLGKDIEEDDAKILEDLIVAAFNNANSNYENESKKAMESATSGLNLPPHLKNMFT